MALVVTIIIALATMAFVAYPMFRSKREYQTATEDDTMQELLSQRDAAYGAIKELEFDYQTGSLSKEDGQELEERYKQKAVSVLKQIDAYKESTPLDDEIEKQVLKLRGGRGKPSTSLEDEIEMQVSELRQSPPRATGLFCSQCGVKQQQTARFCSQCGAPLDRRA